LAVLVSLTGSREHPFPSLSPQLLLLSQIDNVCVQKGALAFMLSIDLLPERSTHTFNLCVCVCSFAPSSSKNLIFFPPLPPPLCIDLAEFFSLEKGASCTLSLKQGRQYRLSQLLHRASIISSQERSLFTKILHPHAHNMVC